MSEFRLKFIEPLAKVFFPEWCGSGLDSHKAFIVKYQVGDDVDLAYHYDNAEVSIYN